VKRVIGRADIQLSAPEEWATAEEPARGEEQWSER